MTVETLQVAIGRPTTEQAWHDLELVDDEEVPPLAVGDLRPLLPGSVSYRYWTADIGLRGGLSQHVTGRLLVHHEAVDPPSSAVAVPAGDHVTYLRIRDNPEIEIVRVGRLKAGT